MKDAFHGSAYPAHGPATEHRGHAATIVRPYRGTRSTLRFEGPLALPRSGFNALPAGTASIACQGSSSR